MKFLQLLLFLVSANVLLSQAELYFPPIEGPEWETISPESLGWCPEHLDSLSNFLDEKNTRSFLVLKDGKMVLEWYFHGFNKDSLWVWNSAGKSLTAFLTGIAQEEGSLSIDDKTSDFLGAGWTSLPPDQEDKITIWNQLTMTSGLNDAGDLFACIQPECLTYLADPGTRWAYHNGPYTLLRDVVSSATGTNYNIYTNQKVKQPTGMDGFWLNLGSYNIYRSTARSMARFGLLVSNNGSWDGQSILSDQTYIEAMRNTSQDINKSYGYLWWLNGKGQHLLPGLQFSIPFDITPDAPDDMYAAVGKDGQILNIIPSQNLIVVRMGEAPDNSFVPTAFLNDIWKELNNVMCSSTSVEKLEDNSTIKVYPNPTSDYLFLDTDLEISNPIILNISGQKLSVRRFGKKLDISSLASGIYFLKTQLSDGRSLISRFIVQ